MIRYDNPNVKNDKSFIMKKFMVSLLKKFFIPVDIVEIIYFSLLQQTTKINKSHKYLLQYVFKMMAK